jgi:3-oxoacyl-[acyl-carrier protein] reductase
METHLAGRSALVCGASKGLGLACAQALAAEGVDVVMVARSPALLEESAAGVRAQYQVNARAVAADITTEEGRHRALAACPSPDIVVTNAGGPPPGHFRDWSRADWIAALDGNMLSAIELIKATVDSMVERRFGRIVNITSSAVKSPIAVLGLSNGARAGLTGFVAGIAREYVQHNVTINNLLPGPFETARFHQTLRGAAARDNVSYESVLEARTHAHPARRFGQPHEFGAACAFLCSSSSGYITGHNLLIDGGQYPGTL